jgi:RNA polymerase sigma-70 factor (ECF subfamily)
MQNGTANVISSSDFGKLFTEYRSRFVDVAYGFVRDEEVARDLVSDSFMAFWEARGRLPEDTNVPAYIFTAVKNRCLDHLETNLRRLNIQKHLHTTRKRILREDIISLSLCDPEKLFSDEVNNILDRTIHKMPKLTRDVFQHSRFDEMNYQEIASRLNIKVSRVNFEISKAIKMLRIEFADYLPIPIFLLIIFSFI